MAHLKIVMPTEENMVPRVPNSEEDARDFAVYGKNPVYIQKFFPTGQVMMSKEKPKKIGLIGTDGKVYFFLLKMDTHGDLRKEGRFMEYASLVNKILEQDFECMKRNLKMDTFGIIPLNRM